MSYISPPTVGQRIRWLREQLGLTQAELAERLGVRRPATVGDWETKDRRPERGTLHLLARLVEPEQEAAVLAYLESGGEPPQHVRRRSPGARSAGAPSDVRGSAAVELFWHQMRVLDLKGETLDPERVAEIGLELYRRLRDERRPPREPGGGDDREAGAGGV